MQQQLVEAIHTLYHNADRQVKKQTGSQLEAWQQSESAWSLSDTILHDPSSTMEAQYFCAQTLRTKVQRDFEELPAQASDALRASLLDLLIRFATGATAVRTQLCLAIAAMAAHIPSKQWGQGGVVMWLAENLGRQSQEVALPCMLELLTVIPEEVGSYRPAVRPERRRQMQQEVVDATPHALQVLASCLNQKGGHVRGQVLHAFAAWLKLSAGAGLDGPALADHPLTKAAMEGLKSTDTFEDASDAVCELVLCTSSRGSPEPQMMPLVQLLVPAVMALRPRFVAAAQQAQQAEDGNGRGYDEDDIEAVKGMARLFAELGESYTALIATASPDSMQPVEALLDVAAFPDQAISSISFNFWHRLMRQLTSGFSGPEAAPGANQENIANAHNAEQQRRLDAFTPAYQQLVTVVVHNVQYPSDYHEWHRDELQEFRHNRYAISETLEDAADVLGWQPTLQLLLRPLQQLATTFDWRVAEASLYCVRSICRQNIPAGEPLLMSLFSSLLSMPTDHEAGTLQYTVAMMIGSYAAWLASTVRVEQRGQLLVSQMLQLLMKSLEHSESAGAAATAIRHICHSCGKYLAASHLDALMQLYQKVQGQGAAAPASSHKLLEQDVQAVIEAVASVVSCLQGDTQAAATRALLDPIMAPLQARLQQPQPNGAGPAQQPSEDVEHVGAFVDRLGTVFKRMAEPGLAAANLAHSWPLLVTVLTQYSSNFRVTEKTGRAIKQALQTSRKASAGMLQQVLETVVRQFHVTGHPCMLYIASELLKTFGGDAQYQAALGQLFSAIVTKALQGLPTLAAFDHNPDMADDTFLLIDRAVRYSPGVVFNPQMLPLIADAAMTGVLVQHREACLSIISVLRRLHDTNEPDREVDCSQQQQQQLRAVIEPRDPLLVRILFGGLLGALPKSRVDDIAAVLYDMIHAYKAAAYPWLTSALAAIPEQAATQADKQNVITAAHSLAAGVDNRWDLESSLDDLSEVCRRNRHSMEAAVRALLPPELYQTAMPNLS